MQQPRLSWRCASVCHLRDWPDESQRQRARAGRPRDSRQMPALAVAGKRPALRDARPAMVGASRIGVVAGNFAGAGACDTRFERARR